MVAIKLEAAVDAVLSPLARQRVERLAEWKLERVFARARERYGWSSRQALSVERAYRQFLALIAIDPDRRYGMADGEIDLIWHEHILDTVDYWTMCKDVFGRMIHHCPVNDDSSLSSEPLYATTTLPALRRTFGRRTSRAWPAAGKTGAASRCCEHIGEQLAA